MFIPVGWEMTLGGVGRPQEKINQELKECDQFILLLWDRWGSPSGAKEGYSSGTEEEYKIALACLNDPAFPMREIVVFFKAVDARQLSDPGPQLQSVLKFRKELEDEKNILFETFDTAESFGEKVRRHLSKWTREHEENPSSPTRRNDGKPTNPESSRKASESDNIEIPSADSRDNTFIENVNKIYKAGKLTDAEQKLVSEVVSKKSIQAYYSYGLFLIKSERLSDAENAFKELSRIAQSESELAWAGTAEARIGGIYRMQGKLKESQDALEKAIKLKQAGGDEKGEMSTYIWLGDLNLSFRKYEKALAAYESALSISKQFNDEKLLADIRFKKAKCESSLGKIDEAIVDAEFAREIYIKNGDSTALKSVKDWKKSKKIPLKDIPARRKGQINKPPE